MYEYLASQRITQSVDYRSVDVLKPQCGSEQKMKHTLCMACVLAAVLSTGYSLNCVECENWDGLHCSKPPISCPQNSVCLSLALRNEVSKSVLRRCSHPSYCNQTFSYVEKGIKTTLSSKCCDQDGCTPTNNVYENGLKCDFCSRLNPDSDSCIEHQGQRCVGNEDKCYSYYRQTENELDLLKRGCTSENLCDGIDGTIAPQNLWGGVIVCDGNRNGNHSTNTTSSLNFNMLLFMSTVFYSLCKLLVLY
ncbi:ly6/PLAUR domain-containing protein 8-like [Hyperolius riggenbachi]|uniref:ly6/PLAUR domain-containing protein 8-like n=1 Tax=Hyperolius riggenbachi TaxID=752182 RepID=UPI0035A2B4CF